MAKSLHEELYDKISRIQQTLRERAVPGMNGMRPLPARPEMEGSAVPLPLRPGLAGRVRPLPRDMESCPAPRGVRGPEDAPVPFGGVGPAGGPHGPAGGPVCHGGPVHRGALHRPFGLRPPFSRERVLELLDESDGGKRQKALAERLHVNPSSMSEFITRLENDGYVHREVDPTDKRATLIVLSELGRARACEIRDMKEESLKKLFSNLTEDEKQQLIRLLDKLKQRGEQDGGPMPV